jgi:hypothetical protein
MWTDDEIESLEANTAVCEVCQERDVTEALVPVYVATAEWHRVERLVHPECRDEYVRVNLVAVMESLRLLALEEVTS